MTPTYGYNGNIIRFFRIQTRNVVNYRLILIPRVG